MLKHYILSTLRHLWRRKLYSIITLLSLTFGLSVFSLIFLHVKWEFSYNRGFNDSASIFQMYSLPSDNRFNLLFEGSGISSTFRMDDTNALGEFLGNSVEDISRTRTISAYERRDGTERFVRMFMVDESFTDVFSLKVSEGDISQISARPGNIAITEELAETMFGDNSAIGQRIDLWGGQSASSRGGEITVTEGDMLEFEVVAVFRQTRPVTTELGFTVLVNDDGYADRMSPNQAVITLSYVWFKLNENADREKIENDLKLYVDQFVPKTTGSFTGQTQREVSPYLLRSIHDIYFEETGDLVRVLSFALLGLMVMIAGCSNAVSLGFASALERKREVGIRKSVGAERSHVMIQFLGEPVMLACFSMIPVFVITGLYHPVFAEMLSFQELPTLKLTDYLLLGLVVLLVGFSIGFYPAFVLSRLRPVKILRPDASQPGSRVLNMRSIMVGIQFSFAIFLLVVTVSLYSQLLVSRSVPLGFNPENMATIDISNESSDLGPVAMKNLVQQIPGITNVIASLNQPSMGERSDSFFNFARTTNAEDQVSASTLRAPVGHFSIYEIPLLAGRDFSEDRDGQNNRQIQQSQDTSFTEKVIVNRSMLKSMLFDSPDEAIGHRLYRFQSLGSFSFIEPQAVEIIGVVEDSMFGGIRSRPGPEVYTMGNDASELMRALNSSIQLTVRYDDSLEGNFQETLTDYLSQTINLETISVTYIEEIVRLAFITEIRESRLMLLCGFLALVLSCSGLFGLVSISMKTRIKEVGIRKVLGASTPSILSTIFKSYSWPVLLANILGWPIAVYFVMQWIQGFPYQLEKFWLIPICLLTSLLVLLIAWVTVSALTYKTASAKPVLALRYE